MADLDGAEGQGEQPFGGERFQDRFDIAGLNVIRPAVRSARVARAAVSTPSLVVAVSRVNTCRATACWAGVSRS